MNKVKGLLSDSILCPPTFYPSVSNFRSCWKLWRGFKERGKLTSTSKDFKASLDTPYFVTTAFWDFLTVIALWLQAKVAFSTLTIGLKQVKLLFMTADTYLFVWFPSFCSTRKLFNPVECAGCMYWWNNHVLKNAFKFLDYFIIIYQLFQHLVKHINIVGFIPLKVFYNFSLCSESSTSSVGLRCTCCTLITAVLSTECTQASWSNILKRARVGSWIFHIKCCTQLLIPDLVGFFL